VEKEEKKMSPQFRSRKDRRGKRYAYPLTKGSGRTYRPPAMKVQKISRRKGLWEEVEEKDRRRIEERERALREENEREAQKLRIEEIVALSKSSDEVTAAMARAELKQKYTDVYEELFNKEVSEVEQKATPEREKIAHEPLRVPKIGLPEKKVEEEEEVVEEEPIEEAEELEVVEEPKEEEEVRNGEYIKTPSASEASKGVPKWLKPKEEKNK